MYFFIENFSAWCRGSERGTPRGAFMVCGSFWAIGSQDLRAPEELLGWSPHPDCLTARRIWIRGLPHNRIITKIPCYDPLIGQDTLLMTNICSSYCPARTLWRPKTPYFTLSSKRHLYLVGEVHASPEDVALWGGTVWGWVLSPNRHVPRAPGHCLPSPRGHPSI